MIPKMEQIENYYIFTDEWGGVWKLELVRNPFIIMPFIITPLEARK